MRVLVACECSGTVRDAFAALGHDAWSCDLKPAPGRHIQGNVLKFLDGRLHEYGIIGVEPWDLMIAHPPCTFLSVSGIHWNSRGRGWKSTEEAARFFMALVNAPIPRICIENPVSIMSTRYRKPDQIIQPHQFGHDASKATCLWLKNLPPLTLTGAFIAPRMVKGKPRWANQTDSGQNRLGPSPERAAVRAVTYPGIAKAMAEQWGVPIPKIELFSLPRHTPTQAPVKR